VTTHSGKKARAVSGRRRMKDRKGVATGLAGRSVARHPRRAAKGQRNPRGQKHPLLRTVSVLGRCRRRHGRPARAAWARAGRAVSGLVLLRSIVWLVVHHQGRRVPCDRGIQQIEAALPVGLRRDEVTAPGTRGGRPKRNDRQQSESHACRKQNRSLEVPDHQHGWLGEIRPIRFGAGCFPGHEHLENSKR
jgi:hypothetical protein